MSNSELLIQSPLNKQSMHFQKCICLAAISQNPKTNVWDRTDLSYSGHTDPFPLSVHGTIGDKLSLI